MSEPHAHPDHQHGPDCGHTAVRHEDHLDYLHDGHLHHPTGHAEEVEEHTLAVTAANPEHCTPGNHAGHEAGHAHGPDCGHEAVPPAITPTTWWTASCTIPTPTTVTTTDRWR